MMEVATFHFDVTPPIGHPLLGGLIPAAAAVDGPLQAVGIVFFGEGLPVVRPARWQGAISASRGPLDRLLPDLLTPGR